MEILKPQERGRPLAKANVVEFAFPRRCLNEDQGSERLRSGPPSSGAASPLAENGEMEPEIRQATSAVAGNYGNSTTSIERARRAS